MVKKILFNSLLCLSFLGTPVIEGATYKKGFLMYLFAWKGMASYDRVVDILGGIGDDFGQDIVCDHSGDRCWGVGGIGSFGNGGMDVGLLRYDVDYDDLRMYTLGSEDDEIGMAIAVGQDDTFLVAGVKKVEGKGSFPLFMQLGDKGLMWQFLLFGDFDAKSCSTVIAAKDEGYIVGCDIEYRYTKETAALIIKVVGKEKLAWKKIIRKHNSTYVTDIVLAEDGSIVVLGNYKEYVGTGNIFVLALDSMGNESWQKGLARDEEIKGYALYRDREGHIFITGEVVTDMYGKDTLWCRLDSQGAWAFVKAIGGKHDDIGYDVKPAEKGFYEITGQTRSYGLGGTSTFMIAMDKNGKYAEARVMGNKNGQHIYATADAKEGKTFAIGEEYDIMGEKDILWLNKNRAKEKHSNPIRPMVSTLSEKQASVHPGLSILDELHAEPIATKMTWHIIREPRKEPQDFMYQRPRRKDSLFVSFTRRVLTEATTEELEDLEKTALYWSIASVFTGISLNFGCWGSHWLYVCHANRLQRLRQDIERM